MRQVNPQVDRVFRKYSALLQTVFGDALVEAGIHREVLNDRGVQAPCFAFILAEGKYFSDACLYLFVGNASHEELRETEFSGIADVMVDCKSACVQVSFKFTKELRAVFNSIDSALIAQLITIIDSSIGSGVVVTRDTELERVGPWSRVFVWSIPV